MLSYSTAPENLPDEAQPAQGAELELGTGLALRTALHLRV